MIQKRKKPEDASLGGRGLMNRTGIATAPAQAKEMVEGATSEPTGVEDVSGPINADALRRTYMKSSDPIGTMPPPTTLKGAVGAVKGAVGATKPTVFMDKIAERLAFERSGTRLYELLILKHSVLGSFAGGPTAEELKHFHDEEGQHFAMLIECLVQAGGDPTAITPSGDVVAVESMGLGQILADPRTTLAQGLHAILVAELADKAGWELLIELGEKMGHADMVTKFRKAEAEEAQHLAAVKRWVSAHAASAAQVKTK